MHLFQRQPRGQKWCLAPQAACLEAPSLPVPSPHPKSSNSGQQEAWRTESWNLNCSGDKWALHRMGLARPLGKEGLTASVRSLTRQG